MTDTTRAGAGAGARAGDQEKNEMNCPLCGARFDAADRSCRASCPMSHGCNMICCPNCGYSFPGDGKLSGALRRFLRGLKK